MCWWHIDCAPNRHNSVCWTLNWRSGRLCLIVKSILKLKYCLNPKFRRSTLRETVVFYCPLHVYVFSIHTQVYEMPKKAKRSHPMTTSIIPARNKDCFVTIRYASSNSFTSAFYTFGTPTFTMFSSIASSNASCQSPSLSWLLPTSSTTSLKSSSSSSFFALLSLPTTLGALQIA